VKSELLAAIATVAFKSLSASEMLSNPFGLYVHAFDWAFNGVAGAPYDKGSVFMRPSI
jgi:type IV secretory pathway TrbF-like protein